MHLRCTWCTYLPTYSPTYPASIWWCIHSLVIYISFEAEAWRTMTHDDADISSKAIFLCQTKSFGRWRDSNEINSCLLNRICFAKIVINTQIKSTKMKMVSHHQHHQCDQMLEWKVAQPVLTQKWRFLGKTAKIFWLLL